MLLMPTITVKYYAAVLVKLILKEGFPLKYFKLIGITHTFVID